MCIMLVVPKGVALPSDAILSQCWTRNDDGAGYMYAKNGRLHIGKGYMTLAPFLEAVHALPSDVDRVLHFRIGTTGAKDGSMTHPHLVSPAPDYTDASYPMQVQGEVAICHNGILSGLIVPPGSKRSDTAIFADDVLADLPAKWWEHPGTHWLIEAWMGTHNKIVVLTAAGQLYILHAKQGTWEAGVWYSNTSFRVYVPVTHDYSPRQSPLKPYSFNYSNSGMNLEDFNLTGMSRRRTAKARMLPKIQPDNVIRSWFMLYGVKACMLADTTLVYMSDLHIEGFMHNKANRCYIYVDVDVLEIEVEDEPEELLFEATEDRGLIEYINKGNTHA